MVSETRFELGSYKKYPQTNLFLYQVDKEMLLSVHLKKTSIPLPYHLNAFQSKRLGLQTDKMKSIAITCLSIKKHLVGGAFNIQLFLFEWCQDPDLNWGHGDFQSPALPTELSRLIPLIMYQLVRTLLKNKLKSP